MLGINGKIQGQFHWVKVDSNNPGTQPGFYGYGETSAANNTNKYWGLRNIKDGGYSC